MRTLLIGTIVITMLGCQPSMQVVNEGQYRAIVAQTYGHPAVTAVVIEKDGKQVYAGHSGDKAVGLHLAGDVATIGQSLALWPGLAAIRPDQTQSSTNVSGVSTSSSGGNALTATGGAGGVGGQAYNFNQSIQGQAQAQSTNVRVRASGGGWVPPGQRDK